MSIDVKELLKPRRTTEMELKIDFYELYVAANNLLDVLVALDLDEIFHDNNREDVYFEFVGSVESAETALIRHKDYKEIVERSKESRELLKKLVDRCREGGRKQGSTSVEG